MIIRAATFPQPRIGYRSVRNQSKFGSAWDERPRRTLGTRGLRLMWTSLFGQQRHVTTKLLFFIGPTIGTNATFRLRFQPVTRRRRSLVCCFWKNIGNLILTGVHNMRSLPIVATRVDLLSAAASVGRRDDVDDDRDARPISDRRIGRQPVAQSADRQKPELVCRGRRPWRPTFYSVPGLVRSLMTRGKSVKPGKTQ